MDDFEYKVGMHIGLKDLIDPDSTDLVEWYDLIGIDLDDDYPIAFFYLKSDADKLNDKTCEYGNYAEIIDSISDRIVIE